MTTQTRSGNFFTRINYVKLIIFVLLALFLIWTWLPIIWMALNALKTDANLFTMPPKVIFKPTLSTFKYLFTEAGILKYIKNSVVVALVSTLISLILGSLGGYALARGRIPGKKHVAFWIISTRMAPIAVVIIPLYMIFKNLGILNTLPALIFAHTTFNLPFAIWLMQGFFKEIPISIEEAALVDGCNRLQAFFHVALPIVLPGLMVTSILSIMFSWNDYAFAVLFTGADSQTLPVVIGRLITMRGVMWGQVMSIGTLIFIPILVAGLLIRKYLVRGLTMGAVK